MSKLHDSYESKSHKTTDWRDKALIMTMMIRFLCVRARGYERIWGNQWLRGCGIESKKLQGISIATLEGK